MNIAYFGSPMISQRLLECLIEKGLNINLVVTQPDKPAGKRLEMTPTPVKKFAVDQQISVFDSALSKNSEALLLDQIQQKQIDLGILFAYGEILSSQVLTSMRYGIWNIHPSLLPRHRGPAPIIFPLILGEAQTGTTLIQMSELLDQGDILKQDILAIQQEDNRAKIERALVDISCAHVVEALSLLKIGKLKRRQQESTRATYTFLLKKQDGFVSQKFLSAALKNEEIQFDLLPEIIKRYHAKNSIQSVDTYLSGPILYHLYQGLHPWPGVWTNVTIGRDLKRLKLLEITLHNQIPQLKAVQLEGKNQTDLHTFIKSYNISFI